MIVASPEQIVATLSGAQQAVTSAQQRIRRIREDVRLSDQGREEQITPVLSQTRGSVESTITGTRWKLESAREAVEKRLAEARAVDPGLLAARAVTLAPVLNAAANDPVVLVRALERHHYYDPAARQLIRHTATSLLDVLNPGAGLQFAEKFGNAERRLTARLSEAERKALADLETIERLTHYVTEVAQVVAADLDETVNPSPDRGLRPWDASVQLATARHRATMFELTNRSEPAPDAAPTPVYAATQTRNGRAYGGGRIR